VNPEPLVLEVAEGRRFTATIAGVEAATFILVGRGRECWAAVFELWSFEVYPAFRGQGLGRKLLRRVEETTRRVGGAALWLRVDKGNARARALYESEGYRVRVIREEDVEMAKELR
jgi:ribosomal protein S18 acetylase RimI-like enzyme